MLSNNGDKKDINPRNFKSSPITLGDIAKILPGIGLLGGWIFYFVFFMFAERQEVKVETWQPVYKNVEFAKIPKDYFVDLQKPEDERIIEYRVINKEIPDLGDDGKPKLEKKENIYSGVGNAKITVSEVNEIMMPILKDPPYTSELVAIKLVPESRAKPNLAVVHKENVQYKGTGVFYIKKKVEFDIGITPESMAVRFATVATLISLLAVIYEHSMSAS